MAKGGRLQQALALHLKQQQQQSKHSKLPKKKPEMESKKKRENPQGDRVAVHVWKARSAPVLASKVPFHPNTGLILLVGEGDFGFARCLTEKHLIQAFQIVATGYDSAVKVVEKYRDRATENIAALKRSGAQVYHGIDAAQLHSNKSLLQACKRDSRSVSRIIFNFPHTGSGIKDRAKNIRKEQAFLKSFFHSSLKLAQALQQRKPNIERSVVMMTQEAASKASQDISYLHKKTKDDDEDEREAEELDTEDAPIEPLEVHVTIKDGDPYDDWEIKKLVPREFTFVHSFAFDPHYSSNPEASLYGPLYRHVRTLGDIDNPSDDFEGRGRTFVWRVTLP